MARSKEQDAGTIRWYSLLSPERRMERRSEHERSWMRS